MSVGPFSNVIPPKTTSSELRPQDISFADLFSPQSGDQDNLPLSTILDTRLNLDSSTGLTFELGGQQYTLIANKHTGNIELKQGEKVIDSNVQIGDQFTPSGFIELGGISSNGSRVYIGRSPDDPTQIVAFVAKDLNRGDKPPALTESNSTVLFTTTPVVTVNDLRQGPTYIVTPSSNGDGNEIFILNYSNPSAPKTEYLGTTIFPPGEYIIDTDDKLKVLFQDTKGTSDVRDDDFDYLTVDPITGKLTQNSQKYVDSILKPPAA